MPPFWDTLGNTILIGGSSALVLFMIAALLTVKGNLVIFKADDLLEEAAAQGKKLEENDLSFTKYKKLEVIHERFIFAALSLLVLMVMVLGVSGLSGGFKYNNATQEILALRVMSQVNSTYAVNVTLEQARLLANDKNGDYDLYNVVEVLHVDGNASVPVAIRHTKDKDVLVYYEKGVKIKDLKEVEDRY